MNWELSAPGGDDSPKQRLASQTGTPQWLTLTVLLWLSLWLLMLPGALIAQTDEAFEREVRAISDQLRCPTCQGISVNDSEAAFSRQIKDKVRRMLKEGQSESQITSYFVSRYGEWILRAPKKEGIGLVLWILPGMLIVLMGGWIGYKIFHGSRGEQEVVKQSHEEPELTPEQLERIQQDMKQFQEDA